MEVDSEKIPWNVDEATDQIMQDLDKSGDQKIDEQEFIDGFKEWLHSSIDEIMPSSPAGTETDASMVSLIKFLKVYEYYLTVHEVSIRHLNYKNII